MFQVGTLAFDYQIKAFVPPVSGSAVAFSWMIVGRGVAVSILSSPWWADGFTDIFIKLAFILLGTVVDIPVIRGLRESAEEELLEESFDGDGVGDGGEEEGRETRRMILTIRSHFQRILGLE